MPNTTPSSILFENIYTKFDAAKLVEKLQQLTDLLFNVKTPLDTVINSVFLPEERDALMEFCKQQNINLHDPVSFQRSVQNLKKEIDELPTIGLELGINPTPDMLHAFSQWFMANFNQKYFLDIKVNPKVIGGAVVIVNGTYRDYTLKKIVEDKFNQKVSKVVVNVPEKPENHQSI